MIRLDSKPACIETRWSIDRCLVVCKFRYFVVQKSKIKGAIIDCVDAQVDLPLCGTHSLSPIMSFFHGEISVGKVALDEKSNLQISSNLLQRFGTAAVCIVLLIFISGLYDFTLHLQIRKYDGLTYCGRIAKIITTAF